MAQDLAQNQNHDGAAHDLPFMVSAPGKVIVFGEHAVVYGKVCDVQAKLHHSTTDSDPGCHRCRNLTSMLSPHNASTTL